MVMLNYRDAVAKALQDSMREEPRLIIIGQNIASHALKQLADTYGTERVRDGRHGGRRGYERHESRSHDRLRGHRVGTPYGHRAERGEASLSHQRSSAVSRDNSSSDRAFSRPRTGGQRSRRVLVLQCSGLEHRDAGLSERSLLEFSRGIATANADAVL